MKKRKPLVIDPPLPPRRGGLGLVCAKRATDAKIDTEPVLQEPEFTPDAYTFTADRRVSLGGIPSQFRAGTIVQRAHYDLKLWASLIHQCGDVLEEC